MKNFFPVLLIGLTSLAILTCARPPRTTESLQTRIIRIQGPAVMVQRGSETFVPAVNDVLSAPDVIRTGKGTALTIGVADLGICFVRPLTVMALSNLDVSGAVRKVSLKLQAGRVSAFVNKLSKKESFSVLAPTAVVGVAGRVRRDRFARRRGEDRGPRRRGQGQQYPLLGLRGRRNLPPGRGPAIGAADREITVEPLPEGTKRN